MIYNQDFYSVEDSSLNQGTTANFAPNVRHDFTQYSCENIKKTNYQFIIGVVVGLVTIVGFGFWYYYFIRKDYSSINIGALENIEQTYLEKENNLLNLKIATDIYEILEDSTSTTPILSPISVSFSDLFSELSWDSDGESLIFPTES